MDDFPVTGKCGGNVDDIVISGIAGKFPESDNIEEFKKNLFDGVDMVTEDERRWPAGTYGLPTRNGKLKDIKSFDATFFGISAKQTHVMDPHIRIILELTHEAIIDAGVNPSDIKGSKTGVFIGVSSSASESEQYWNSDPSRVNGYGILGCCRNMFANRISFAFDFTGPSYAVDAACSSTLYAMQQAVAAIKSGQCEAAVVGGVHLLLQPTFSLQLSHLHMLNSDGKCKTFDERADGYVRSEAAVIIYLQKCSVAKRVYATVVGAKTNTGGVKHLGITYPVGSMQNKLIREVYDEMKIDPHEVEYIEAHGTGTKAGDVQEVNSIADAFCTNRKTPLLIGSLKTNMGHSEPASGMCSVAKIIIAMETGIIPQNLHFKKPNPDIPALHDGRIKVVDKNQPWNGGYIGINSFGFGGSNAHVILKPNPKAKISNRVTEIPRIYTVSGRTTQAVQHFLDKLDETSGDDELMALIHNIHKDNIVGHGYRGYSLIGDQTVKEIGEVLPETRPIWFVYSGMGGQWPQMGRHMMKLPPFKKAIEKCGHILRPKGLNLEEIITQGDESVLDNVTNSFVAISAIQIALTDTLVSLGIQPDGIVGHSVGEVGCAYADGCLTMEQAILTSFLRGKSIIESKVPGGAMASIGLTWEECKTRCPPDIYPACHNCLDNVTISGPPESIKKFVNELSNQKVFAKSVNSSGQAFHSKYIANAGPSLRKSLDEIIPTPKPRSSRWISSSIPENEWDSPTAQLSSAAYHVNNVLSPVLFYEAIKHIPENAIVVEVAPHCLMQSILKKALGNSFSYVGLMKRGHENNLDFFMSSLGKLYINGAHPKVSTLYPPISYPVGRGTPMLQPMIKWDHSTEWFVPNFLENTSKSGETTIEIDLSKEEDAFLAGHCADYRILLPASAYMNLVWKTLARARNKEIEQVPIVFENIQFHRATILQREGSVRLSINILESSGNFEIYEGEHITVTGRAYIPTDITTEVLELPKPEVIQEKDVLKLTSADIYKEFRLRGCQYSGIFKGIVEADNRVNVGLLNWEGNWITFIDTMLQFFILGQDLKDLYLATSLKRIVIDPRKHLEYVADAQMGGNGQKNIEIYLQRNIGYIKSGGIEINKMDLTYSPSRQQNQNVPKLEKYLFVPYENDKPICSDFEKAKTQILIVLLQIVIENSSIRPRIVELVEDNPPESILAEEVVKIIEDQPTILKTEYTIITSGDIERYQTVAQNIGAKMVQNKLTDGLNEKNNHLIVGKSLINEKILVEKAIQCLSQGGFILTEEENFGTTNNSILSSLDLELVSKQIAGSKTYLLLRKSYKIPSDNIVVHITEQNFTWVEPLKKALKKSQSEGTKVYLVAQNEERPGLMGLTTCLMIESGGQNVRSVLVQDKRSEKFSTNSKFFATQLKKDLVFNVLKNGVWGTYRHILLDKTIGDTYVEVENAYIDALSRDLSKFGWIQKPSSCHNDAKSNNDVCSVYYVALNSRDILLASGKLSPNEIPGNAFQQKCTPGIEFSGRNKQGRKVMGMVPSGCLATNVLADPGFLWEVPDKWSLQEASTIPVAYGMSYYASIILGQIKTTDSILIHGGTEDISQAAISIALHMGCTIFTTVGTQTQREYIKKNFPQLTEKHIGSSNDTSYVQMVLEHTKGQGVDLVLNPLDENMLQSSVRCLAKHGRLLNIGKTNFAGNNLSMELFQKNISFHSNLFDKLFSSNDVIKKEINRLVSEGIKNNCVHPIPAKIFVDDQVEQAIRFFTNKEHIGKVVIKIRDEENSPNVKLVSALPRTYLDPDKTYILVGGLGGFGLELTNWLITRGATKVVLCSRGNIRTGYQSRCVRRWRERGTNVVVYTQDISTEIGAKKLLQESNKLGPVGGIFNLAVDLRDALMENQFEADFKTVCCPKVEITKYLDSTSRTLCPNLDYFIAFSSASCGRGNRGQANYGYANSILERICEARQTDGYPGLAIQWSVIGDVGVTMETLGEDTNVILVGSKPQRIQSCLETIDYFMQLPDPVLSSIVLAEKQRTSAESDKFCPVNAVAKILGIRDVKSIQPNLTLTDLGMDSIMSAEIEQTLERNFELNLRTPEIRELTFAKLTELSL